MNHKLSASRGRWGLVILMAAALLVPTSRSIAQDQRPIVPAAVAVSGTSTLVGELSPGTASSGGGVVSVRDNILETIERASDPRVSGRATIVVNFDAYPDAQGRVGATQVRYGTMRLENAEGAWSGRFAGRLSDDGFLQTYWLEGEDGYAGLSYVVTAGGNGQTWRSSGLIYPGALPPLGGGPSFELDGPGTDLPTA